MIYRPFDSDWIFVHLYLQRKKNPDIVYDEPQDISSGPSKPPTFKCILTINGTQKFEGIGQSKKMAKSSAAEQALTKLFKVHFSSLRM